MLQMKIEIGTPPPPTLKFVLDPFKKKPWTDLVGSLPFVCSQRLCGILVSSRNTSKFFRATQAVCP